MISRQRQSHSRNEVLGQRRTNQVVVEFKLTSCEAPLECRLIHRRRAYLCEAWIAESDEPPWFSETDCERRTGRQATYHRDLTDLPSAGGSRRSPCDFVNQGTVGSYQGSTILSPSRDEGEAEV